MRRLKWVRLLVATAALLVGAQSAGATPLVWTFETIPADGALSGFPGSSLSWQYAIVNEDPTLWLSLEGFDSGTHPFGTPMPTFDFPIIAPTGTAPSLDSSYFVGSATGDLFTLLNLDAAPGSQNVDVFTLFATWYTDNPLTGGVPFAYEDHPDGSTSLSASFEALIDEPPASVPEPGSFVLLGTGLAGAAFVARRRRSR